MAAVILSGDTSGTVSLGAPAIAGTQAYTLPTGYPATSGYALTSTTGGVMSWAASGGNPILESYQTISQNYTITTSSNGLSAGPVAVATGYAVTIPTGQTWTVLA